MVPPPTQSDGVGEVQAMPLITRRGDADAPAVVANVAPMPSMSVECKEAFRPRFGAACRHVSRTRHPRRPPAPKRRPRAVGIGRVSLPRTGLACALPKSALGRDPPRAGQGKQYLGRLHGVIRETTCVTA